GKFRQEFQKELGMVQHPDAELRVGRNLPVVLVQHRRAIRAAGKNISYPVFAEGLGQLFAELQVEIFVAGAARRFSATSFPREHTPGNAGGIENLLHGRSDRLSVRIETQTAAKPEKPLLAAIE